MEIPSLRASEGMKPSAPKRRVLPVLFAVGAMLIALLATLPAAAAAAAEVGIATLAAGVADPALRNVMLSMWAEFEGQIAAERHSKEVLRADLQGQIAAERRDKEVLRADMHNMEADFERQQKHMQGQIHAERSDKEQLAGRVNRCEADMHELSDRTCSRSRVAAVEAGVAAIEAERKQEGGEVASLVKAETASLVEHIGRVDKHRRMQEAAQCQGEAMLAACSPAGGGGAGNGHRRQLQGGCSGFPASCSSERADLFVQYYEVCQGMITAMAAGEQSLFESFFGVCSEKPGPALCAPPSPADIQLWLRA